MDDLLAEILEGLAVTPEELEIFRHWTEKLLKEDGEAWIRRHKGLLHDQAEYLLELGITDPPKRLIDSAERQYWGHPKDKSVVAYRAWILGIVQKMGGNAKEDVAPEEWERDWRLFWGR